MVLALKLSLIIIGILFLLIFFSPSALKAAIIGAPFLPTPKRAIRKALKIANLKPNEKLYDLGSGTGRVLIIAAKEFGAKVVGFEYSRPLFFLSKLNLFLHGIKNGKIYRKNFFQADLRESDVVFLFLTPKAFPKLKDKFIQELKPGARIITFSSPLLFWQPQNVISLPGIKGKLYLYSK
ncbi:MAG: methyltransferase domain-containing protein [Patescibacteria group bacterium]|nr:methyltransferase domain-containing protein [Patescibacteria group bacterium]